MILVRGTPGADADVLVMDNPPAHSPLPTPLLQAGEGE